MFKRIFFLGLCSGSMASVAGIVYNRVYIFALGVNFSKLVNNGSIIAANMGILIIASLGYYLLNKRFKKNTDRIFNSIVTLLTFASIIIPISITLPLDINNPELFPGLAVPMHFFPAIAWFTMKPFIIRDTGS